MKKEDLKKQLEAVKGLGNTPQAFECLLGTMASINYQLTRIADRMCEAIILDSEDDDDTPAPDVPADALVVAVESIAERVELDQISVKRIPGILREALATHEKAVGK